MPNKTTMTISHQAFEKMYPNADTIVVFSHGFIGSPNQFEEMAELAYQNGCSVLSLLLPGHGGQAKDFRTFGLDDWERHLEHELRRVSASYEHIILVGHSIGGLLCLNAALDKNPKIKAVLLISSPLKLRYSPKPLLIGMRLHLFPKRTNELLDAYRKSSSITGASMFHYLFWRKQVTDMYRLMAKTKANLPAVRVPTTVIYSTKDETVSPKSAALFRNGLTNTDVNIIALHASHHAFYPAEERAVIHQELLRLIFSIRRMPKRTM